MFPLHRKSSAIGPPHLWVLTSVDSTNWGSKIYETKLCL
jgi:hypothetical protein